MGLFQTKKIKLEKIMKEGSNQYFIDYYKLKDPDGFFLDFIQDFTENKNSLMVINTDIFYAKNSLESENKIIRLKKEFDKQDISYGEVITKKESENKIFGLKIQNSVKVNNYQIGLAVTPDQIRNVTGLVKDCNVFYYIDLDDIGTEELIKQFYDVRGDYDELNKLSGYNLFNDCYFHRIRICSRQDISRFIEKKLQKYQ